MTDQAETQQPQPEEVKEMTEEVPKIVDSIEKPRKKRIITDKQREALTRGRKKAQEKQKERMMMIKEFEKLETGDPDEVSDEEIKTITPPTPLRRSRTIKPKPKKVKKPKKPPSPIYEEESDESDSETESEDEPPPTPKPRRPRTRTVTQQDAPDPRYIMEFR